MHVLGNQQPEPSSDRNPVTAIAEQQVAEATGLRSLSGSARARVSGSG